MLPMSEPEFVLKTTPPRVPRAALERPRLMALWEDLRERTAVSVCAPAGYGKSTLLGQWRRRWLEQGATVAWLSVDAQDDASRFTAGLLHSLHAASARPGFAVLAAQAAAQPGNELAMLTALLAEIASLGGETVVVIDDAERLPEATAAGALTYLLHHAPSNLHVLLGSRTPLALRGGVLAARGQLATLRSEDLRLRTDESAAIVCKRFGERLSLDDAMRLHEASEGWPLGLQLALAAIELAPEPAVAIASLSGRHGDVARYFLDSLLARLPPPLAEFLVAISALEHVSGELCEAVTGDLLAADWLDQLALDTPILMVAELPGWSRLHPLARDFLRDRFEQWPSERRQPVHRRACEWFAQRERYHEAAVHALAAGDTAQSHAYAMRALWPLAISGRLAEARDWLDRIPAQTLEADGETRLIGAWIMALGERHDEAFAIACETLDDAQAPPRLRAMASRVAAGAGAYADRLGIIESIFARVTATDVAELESNPVYASARGNTLAIVATHAGDTARAREFVDGLVRRYDGEEAMRLPLTFSRTGAALSYLWDGRPQLAYEVLRAALADAERREGRRGSIPCLIAPLASAARLELGDVEGARALMAGRLDVVERVGSPDALWLAYRTLLYLALAQGDERRALHVIDGLAALARRRRLPRLAMHAHAEATRLHAIGGRLASARESLAALESMAPAFAPVEFAIFAPRHALLCAFAGAHVALGADAPRDAEACLDAADALAARLRRGRDVLEAQVLRAVAFRMRGCPDALPVLREASSLAALAGHARLVADTHPLAAQMEQELPTGRSAPPPVTIAQCPEPAPQARAGIVRSGPLTPKEVEILSLLDNGLSNKLIARALEISDETVKWHLKNLFLKLAAANRKHAVDRARLLGLIEG
jgi:LuxR family maltose regulon positive regulatory protein